MCYFIDTDCAQVLGEFKNITIVITRDKYMIPPQNYLVQDRGLCLVNVGKLSPERTFAFFG